jgi:hypothetical protein
MLTAGEYPPVVGRLLTTEEGNSRELGGCRVVDARALGSVAAGEPLPGFVGGVTDELVDAPAAGEGLDLLRLRDRDDVAQLSLLKHAAEVPVLAVESVRRHPGNGQG